MAAQARLATFNCSLAKALAIVGDGWSMLILRDAFLGTRTFGGFQQSLGIARNILSDRLARLVDGGVLERSGTTRPTYELTTMSWDLMPAPVALMQWGDRWLADGSPPMLLQEPGGATLEVLRLRAGDRSLDARDVEVRAGPGADARTRAFLQRRLDQGGDHGDTAEVVVSRRLQEVLSS